MAKKKSANRTNQVSTREIKIRTTEKVYADLEKLVDSGYFGKSPAQAAEQLMREALRAEMKEKKLI